MQTSYRNAIAAALLTLSLAACAPVGSTQAQRAPQSTIGTDADPYSRVCKVYSEDSPIPAHCKLDPNARYTYRFHAWYQMPNDTTYANGNRPPTGAELLENAPVDE